MRRLIAATAILCTLVPALAFAQSDDVLSQIQSLLSEITALQSQIQNFSTGSSTPAVSTQPVTTTPVPAATASAPSASCPSLSRTLTRGISGTDVLSLQQFLIAQGLLSADSSTGFFGALTEAAVQQFQSANSIVSSGDPATTGFGIVGVRTRSIVQQQCTPTAKSLACPYAPIPDTPCAGTWSAITDGNGCTHAWQCAVPLPSSVAPIACTTTNTVALSCPAGMQAQIGQNCSQRCTPITTTTTATNSAVFSASPVSGAAPLSVTFTYTPPYGQNQYRISYGDSQVSGYLYCNYSGSNCTTQTIQHTYASAGTYTAQFQVPSGTCSDTASCAAGAFTTISTVTIIVGGVSASCPVYSTPLCSSTQHLVGGLYNSAIGCYAAPSCVANTASSAQCQLQNVVVDCAQGYHYTGTTYTTDGNGCSVPQTGQCVAN